MNTAKRSGAPRGFGVRQSSAALGSRRAFESGRGLPQSKTLPRKSKPLAIQPREPGFESHNYNRIAKML